MSRVKTEIGKKIDAVALAFGMSPRTVKTWHAEGCDISDAGEVLAWKQQKSQNRRTGKVTPSASMDSALNGHRRDQAGVLNLEVLEKLPPATGEGAAAALKRLQGLESIFYSRQLEALAKGRNDLIAYALTDYRRITQTLLDYERKVELAMRDSGQLIPRGEAESGAASVARWFRLGWQLWMSSSLPDLLPLAGDPRAFKAKAEQTFSEIMKTVFMKAAEAKIAVPAWALHAIKDEYRADVP